MSNVDVNKNKSEPLTGDGGVDFELEIKSNTTEEVVPLENATGVFQYLESILADSIGVSYTFGDAIGGNTAPNIVGTEEVNIKMTDNFGNKINLNSKNNNALYVTEVTPLIKESNKKMTTITMRSEVFIRIEQSISTIKNRYDGNISDSVKKILENKLQTQKKLDIETSMNTYNFIGNNRKPFYIINWLSKKCIPNNFKKGGSAGFFFFETSNGFTFKSIDGLFSQKPVKKFIFTGTSRGIPEGYDAKIIDYIEGSSFDVGKKLKMGIYQTKLILFDPFNNQYRVVTQTADDVTGVKTDDGVKLLGKGLPDLNKKFSFNDNTTRTTYMLKDTGTLPTGNTKTQVEKSAEQNFEIDMLLNQANRRYNQVFSSTAEITIAADFSLHAGDIVHVDSPEITADKSDKPDSFTGGLYIITDLCHYITVKESYTKLSLARDSYGRTPLKRD